MLRSRRTDLIPLFYVGYNSANGNSRVLIIFYEPEEPNTTVEIGVFFSTEQIWNRFKKDNEWLVNEECGNDVINEIKQQGFLPIRSSIPPRFAYGHTLEDLWQVSEHYKEQVKELQKKLNGTADEDDTNNEPRQLPAPKDPKRQPN